MDLITLLKKLKEVEPDRAYTERSRQLIFDIQQAPKKSWGSFARFVFESFQYASATALVLLLVVIVLGGITLGNRTSRLPGLDLTNLRAEANAIDVQIELMSLNYFEHQEFFLPNHETTTIPFAPTVAPLLEKSDGETSVSSTTDFTIDEVLNQLSQ